MSTMLPSARAGDSGFVEGDQRQQQNADESGEEKQHRDVAVLEILLDEILVQMGGNGPQDRSGKRKDQPGHRYLLLLRPAWKGFEVSSDFAAEGTLKTASHA